MGFFELTPIQVPWLALGSWGRDSFIEVNCDLNAVSLAGNYNQCHAVSVHQFTRGGWRSTVQRRAAADGKSHLVSIVPLSSHRPFRVSPARNHNHFCCGVARMVLATRLRQALYS